jgi:hypothetical protein
MEKKVNNNLIDSNMESVTQSYHDNNVQKLITYIKNHFDDFNYKPIVDENYFKLLQQEFPEVNVFEQFKNFHAWTLDSIMPKTNLRMRFRNWLQNSKKFF